MEAELNKLCDFVCSSDFKCHWTKLEQHVQYLFPDGTRQTCVGAQVRCGCTCTMRMISYITYEHPTSVMLSLIFISTIVIYFILRCIVLKQSCFTIFCCAKRKEAVKPPALATPRDVVISALNLNSETTISVNSSIVQIQECDLYTISSDKPPAYSNAVFISESDIDNSLPPSYDECAKTESMMKI